MNVLDLFSGIGGFSLGLERAGMRTVAFCEIEPYCRAVLRKHWPDVPQYDDIRTLTAERLKADGIAPIDVICGGFPCQDISVAGKGGGLSGTRSGLWTEYRRLINESRPSWVIIENVSALRARGLEQVLGEVAALGYDAEWNCIPASAVGAPHKRDRVWIVAYPRCERDESERIGGIGSCASGNMQGEMGKQRLRLAPADCREDVADSNGEPLGRPAISWHECDQWLAEPNVGRVAYGIPSRMDRLRALGNAVVPQIPEIIGRAIMQAERVAA